MASIQIDAISSSADDEPLPPPSSPIHRPSPPASPVPPFPSLLQNPPSSPPPPPRQPSAHPSPVASPHRHQQQEPPPCRVVELRVPYYVNAEREKQRIDRLYGPNGRHRSKADHRQQKRGNRDGSRSQTPNHHPYRRPNPAAPSSYEQMAPSPLVYAPFHHHLHHQQIYPPSYPPFQMHQAPHQALPLPFHMPPYGDPELVGHQLFGIDQSYLSPQQYQQYYYHYQ